MSYSIQNKLCDDVLGLVKSFRGKTHKEILFNEFSLSFYTGRNTNNINK